MGVIPRAVDEYFQFRVKYWDQPLDKRLGNPAHHIHNGEVPPTAPPVSFQLLLNLCSVLGSGTEQQQLLNYLKKYRGLVDDIPVSSPAYLKLASEWAQLPRDPDDELGALIDFALAYNRDVVAPTLKRRKPEGVEIAALERLDRELAALPAGATATDIQNIVYAIGNEGGFEQLRDWFKALYETLLGSSAGPRMGSFIALYGVENSRKLIAEALS